MDTENRLGAAVVPYSQREKGDRAVQNNLQENLREIGKADPQANITSIFEECDEGNDRGAPDLIIASAFNACIHLMDLQHSFEDFLTIWERVSMQIEKEGIGHPLLKEIYTLLSESKISFQQAAALLHHAVWACLVADNQWSGSTKLKAFIKKDSQTDAFQLVLQLPGAALCLFYNPQRATGELIGIHEEEARCFEEILKFIVPRKASKSHSLSFLQAFLNEGAFPFETIPEVWEKLFYTKNNALNALACECALLSQKLFSEPRKLGPFFERFVSFMPEEMGRCSEELDFLASLLIPDACFLLNFSCERNEFIFAFIVSLLESSFNSYGLQAWHSFFNGLEEAEKDYYCVRVINQLTNSQCELAFRLFRTHFAVLSEEQKLLIFLEILRLEFASRSNSGISLQKLTKAAINLLDSLNPKEKRITSGEIWVLLINQTACHGFFPECLQLLLRVKILRLLPEKDLLGACKIYCKCLLEHEGGGAVLAFESWKVLKKEIALRRNALSSFQASLLCRLAALIKQPSPEEAESSVNRDALLHFCPEQQIHALLGSFHDFFSEKERKENITSALKCLLATKVRRAILRIFARYEDLPNHCHPREIQLALLEYYQSPSAGNSLKRFIFLTDLFLLPCTLSILQDHYFHILGILKDTGLKIPSLPSNDKTLSEKEAALLNLFSEAAARAAQSGHLEEVSLFVNFYRQLWNGSMLFSMNLNVIVQPIQHLVLSRLAALQAYEVSLAFLRSLEAHQCPQAAEDTTEEILQVFEMIMEQDAKKPKSLLSHFNLCTSLINNRKLSGKKNRIHLLNAFLHRFVVLNSNIDACLKVLKEELQGSEDAYPLCEQILDLLEGHPEKGLRFILSLSCLKKESSLSLIEPLLMKFAKSASPGSLCTFLNDYASFFKEAKESVSLASFLDSAFKRLYETRINLFQLLVLIEKLHYTNPILLNPIIARLRSAQTLESDVFEKFIDLKREGILVLSREEELEFQKFTPQSRGL